VSIHDHNAKQQQCTGAVQQLKETRSPEKSAIGVALISSSCKFMSKIRTHLKS